MIVQLFAITLQAGLFILWRNACCDSAGAPAGALPKEITTSPGRLESTNPRTGGMLAEGFRVGDQLYYIGAGLDFGDGNGDRLEYGTRGKVCGPPEHPSVPCGVSMRFPGNKGTSSHFVCFLSRSPPCPSLMKGFTIGARRLCLL